MVPFKFFYEVPLFIFVILAIYSITLFTKSAKLLAGGKLQKSMSWLLFATIFFTLWGIDHIYHDLVPLSPDMRDFFHYIVSHGMLLIALVCLAVSAHATNEAYGSVVSTDKK